MAYNRNQNSKNYHTVYESDLKLSNSRLRISLQKMYESGRQSVFQKPFSVSEIFTGAFVAELITALVYLFSSESPELILQGIWEKPLVVHVVASIILGVIAAASYYHKSSMRHDNQTDIDKRDCAVDDELNTLYWNPEFDDEDD